MSASVTLKRIEKLTVAYEKWLNDARNLLGNEHPLMTMIYDLHGDLMGLWGNALEASKHDSG